MNLKNKWIAIAGSALVVGGLLTGAAFAAGNTADGKASRLDQAVASGKLTQAEADLLKQIAELRKAAMEKFKADVQGLIDQAVKDGKITQAQADQLKKKAGQGFDMHGRKGWHKGGRLSNLTPEQLKQKLDEKVKAGKLTQEQADQILKRFTERKSKAPSQAQPQSPSQSQ